MEDHQALSFLLINTIITMNTEGREEYVVARQPSRQRQNEQVSYRGEQGDSTIPLLRNKESPIGAQFERLRRSAIFDLKDFIRFQGPNRAEQFVSLHLSLRRSIIDICITVDTQTGITSLEQLVSSPFVM